MSQTCMGGGAGVSATAIRAVVDGDAESDRGADSSTAAGVTDVLASSVAPDLDGSVSVTSVLRRLAGPLMSSDWAARRLFLWSLPIAPASAASTPGAWATPARPLPFALPPGASMFD